MRDLIIDVLIRALCFVLPWRHRVVPDAITAAPMLRQFAIIRGGSWLGKRVGALYLQHFLAPEPVDFMHRHRWERMRSWVLSGVFVEERPQILAWQRSKYTVHRAGEHYEMDHSVIHRVAYWSRQCWTLFHMSPEASDDWGWYSWDGVNLGDFRPWREHIAKRVPSLDTGKVTE